ncbi:MAG TPA: DUF3109 domain-containing protein [Bacteroidetes bacterium]|nr:DUF3109 domain-containing protein [Bacteroidota bacterium]
MILIDNTIVSDDLIEKEFVCNLQKCKGECCVAGESGAPLNPNETQILEEIFSKVKPYMEQDGISVIEKLGKWLVDSDGDFVTPLINGKGRCAYVYFENEVAKCAIEKAYKEGKTDFQKPISCHLYPVRIKSYKNYDAVNYERWKICSPACSHGKQLGVPVYQFVKNALIRKYGQDWFTQLEGAAKFIEEKSELNKKEN